ncbi:MAG: hypothetical protein JF626_09325, partial [Polaromonas sp.]|nr:hypothetical protein [Polaromonas sp.]
MPRLRMREGKSPFDTGDSSIHQESGMLSGYCVRSVLSVLAVVSATSAFAQDKVKIAIVGPLSGQAANY